MAATAPHQQPTPEHFFNAINAYEQTEAMKAAVELEIFTAIAEGNTSAGTIAKRCEAAERGVRTLCDFLTVHGFLTKEGAQYALAPDSALFLNRHSPAYIGTAIEFLLTPRLREGHARLTEAVRRGGSALGGRDAGARKPRLGEVCRGHDVADAYARRDHGCRTPQRRRGTQSPRYRRRSRHLRNLRGKTESRRTHLCSRLEECARSRKEECAGHGSCRSLPPASRQRLRNRFWQRLRSGVNHQFPAPFRSAHLHHFHAQGARRAKARRPRRNC